MEGSVMKAHVWMPQRSFASVLPVPRRLDQAYQLLLSWTPLSALAPVIPSPDSYPQEVLFNAHCPLCPGLQPAPGPGPDHRTTVGAFTSACPDPGLDRAPGANLP